MEEIEQKGHTAELNGKVDADTDVLPAPTGPPAVTSEEIVTAGPSRQGLWAALFYAAWTMALGYPAIAGKFLAGQYSDQFIAGYAFREFGASVLRATGSFPLWNPYLFGGMPFVAAMHGDIFYPTFLMRLVMPTDVAMTWGFILHLFLAGFFTFRFLRASGFGFHGSLIGGAAYMMSGQLASLVSPGHDGKLSVSALFPLGLWMLTLGMRGGKRWSWGVFALTVGLAVLSPHPQLLQYMLLASAAFTIFLAVSGVRAGAVTAGKAVARMAMALGSVVLGLAMGAIQYLPVREYVAWSPRAEGIADYATATSYGWPAGELFDAYLPQFSGMIEGYWGANAIHLHSDYLGAIVLLLAGAAFGGLRKDPRRGFVLFWTVSLVIALLWALGGDTPFYRIPFAIVPGTKYFRAPATVFFVGAAAIAVLAATGAERVLRRELSLRYVIGWVAFAMSVGLLAVSGVLTDIAQALAADDMADYVIANEAAVTLGAWRSFAFVFFAVIVILVYRKGKIPLGTAGLALAFLVAADGWTIMRKYWTFSEPASVVYASDPAIEHVRADPEPSRVLALELEPNPRRDTNLQGDGLMIHRVRGVLGYHGNQLELYNRLLQKDRGFMQVFNPQIWELLNVRYLMTNTADVAMFFPGARWVIGPVTNAAGTPVYLYRLPGENPYAWVTPTFVKAEDDAVAATIFNRGFDLRRAALFAPVAPVGGPDTLGILPLPTPTVAKVTRYAPGRVSIELSEPAPPGSALVVSENYYPGWLATVDGKDAPVGRANISIMGVELPAGGRNVELVFQSPTFRTGKLVTLFALAAVAFLIIAGIIRERKAIART
ncbi:MAG: YfhO family protein [Gemmatimonadaceae bacterium]